MVQTINFYEGKLQEAAEFLANGQKKKARLLIRDVLAADENNLDAWELLYRASYTSREQLICLNQILKIQPDHPWARQQLAFIKAVGGENTQITSSTKSYSLNAASSLRPRGKRRQEPMLTWAIIMVAFLGVICIATWALAAYRIGVLPVLATNETATAYAANQANCRTLIEQAMRASGQFCDQIGSNRVCYGNNTVKADLVPNTGQSFSKRGDIVNIVQLQRLSASPLNTESNEWGIAVFQIQANLPRSLPGEMVKMVVFGNTNLRKESPNLQSFYFSSELGQLVCEKMPYDGLMVSMPNGTGVRFTVNGADMILMGVASLKATKNDSMQVSLFSGAARISSGGKEQLFGPGQKVFLRLGGNDGVEAVGPPSTPQPLSPAEYNVACGITGSYCSPSDIKPISVEQITSEIMSALGITPEPSKTPTLTPTPTDTATPIPSLTPIPTLTPRPTFTLQPTNTPFQLPAPTRTPRPTRTPTKGAPPSGPTATLGPTSTLGPPPTSTNTPTITFTPPPTDTPTATTTPPTAAVCGDVTTGGLTNAGSELDMNITNSHGSPVSITSAHITWVKKTFSQKLAKIFLNGNLIWNTSDPAPASDIPSEGDWKAGAVLTIPDATTWQFAAQFQNPLESGDYSVALVLDIGCQVQASITVP